MYIQVRLLNGFQQPLIYKIPSDWPIENLKDAFVYVPLQKRKEMALVEQIITKEDYVPSFRVKEAYKIEPIPLDASYHIFIKRLSSYYTLNPIIFYRRIKSFLRKHQESHLILPTAALPLNHSPFTPQLTQEQQAIVDFVAPFLITSSYQPILLHGVTGSGKTEVYKKIIIDCFNSNKAVILLLPEVSLAIQFSMLLRRQLPSSYFIYEFHSATHQTEKKALWNHLLNIQEPYLIIGVHLPLLLPLPRLGCIIIDEEHEIGYQEKKHPKINTKEAALLKASIISIPIILGSATPSISSLYNTKHRNWAYFPLHQRFLGIMPEITIVPMRTARSRKNFWISKELETALTQCIERKEQALIFLNRRGYNFFIQCSSCSLIYSCISCSVSLTVHEKDRLLCHYCGYTCPAPQTCSSCSKTDFIKKGIGTQQLTSLIQNLFPQARVARADLEVTSNKKIWKDTLETFYAGKLDILVGTQTITKGYHFPKVTLVGIIWADCNLGFPSYNATETTLQQLIQVAGRAGREQQKSLVVVQTMSLHPLFTYLKETNYADFYTYESELRYQLQYPPFVRLAEIEVRNSNEKIADQEIETCADFLRLIAHENKFEFTILGPAAPPVHKIKNTYIRTLYIKSKTMKEILEAYRILTKKGIASSLFFTPNPL
jgi:primosomal protein N' (replication factor Y) (superfamily II helicase)